ncbi:MAG: hypothetical protein C5B52_18365 [Bacteroidetes bacterium]|nr:MAG: hypothetical protein C5B52_18365 [Bacteroidota bacterium]
MIDDKEKMQVEFHNRSNDKLFAVYQAFQYATSNVSRRTEEVSFQQLKKNYAAALEQELQAIAKEILHRNRNERQIREVGILFNQFIRDYLHRFIQKINDL